MSGSRGTYSEIRAEQIVHMSKGEWNKSHVQVEDNRRVTRILEQK